MGKINWIEGTPLGVKVYSVTETPTERNEDVLEIIFCLQGSVKFSYAYEEFMLTRGDFISVDKDAYYLYDGKDNICVSVYIDLKKYVRKYPYILTALFVCEAFEGTESKYPTEHHNMLKGILISLLKYCSENSAGSKKKKIKKISDKIIEIFVSHFDIAFYYRPEMYFSPTMVRQYREINQYLYNNMKKHVVIKELAEQQNITEGYVSEFLRKFGLGFRGILSYLRANASEKYLLNTEKTIVEISEECGFSDVKYYYKAFRQWYKCTPNQFRKKYGSANKYKMQVEYLDIKDLEQLVEPLLIEHYLEIFSLELKQ